MAIITRWSVQENRRRIVHITAPWDLIARSPRRQCRHKHPSPRPIHRRPVPRLMEEGAGQMARFSKRSVCIRRIRRRLWFIAVGRRRGDAVSPSRLVGARPRVARFEVPPGIAQTHATTSAFPAYQSGLYTNIQSSNTHGKNRHHAYETDTGGAIDVCWAGGPTVMTALGM